ncbi:unnamed protein product [Trichobilharzia regenti]|nr:unnamed protein product [Trichobilharzia regenti]
MLDYRIKEKEEGKLYTSVYKRPTHSANRYLDFNSSYPLSVRAGLVNYLTNRATSLLGSTSKSLNDEMKQIGEEASLLNDYHMKFTRKIRKGHKQNKNNDYQTLLIHLSSRIRICYQYQPDTLLSNFQSTLIKYPNEKHCQYALTFLATLDLDKSLFDALKTTAREDTTPTPPPYCRIKLPKHFYNRLTDSLCSYYSIGSKRNTDKCSRSRISPVIIGKYLLSWVST